MRLLLTLCLVLVYSYADATVYYLREAGAGANMAAATGPCSTDANTASVATHNADNGGTIAAGDTLIVCDDNGVLTAQLTTEVAGTSGNPVTYVAETASSGITTGTDVAGIAITHDFTSVVGLTIDAGTTSAGILINGAVNDLVVKNCTFTGSQEGIESTPGDNSNSARWTFENNDMHTLDQAGYLLIFGDADNGETSRLDHVTISGGELYDIGSGDCTSVTCAGIRVYGADNDEDETNDRGDAWTIEDLKIHDIDGYGISVQEIDSTLGKSYIRDNSVWRSGLSTTLAGNGLWLSDSRGVTVERNTVVMSARSAAVDAAGIYLDRELDEATSPDTVKGCTGITVRHNKIWGHDHNHGGLPFGGAAYTVDSAGITVFNGGTTRTDTVGTWMEDNLIYGNLVYGCAFGINLKGDMRNNLFYNNTLINNRVGVGYDLYSASSTGNTFKNNLIAHNTKEGDSVTVNYGFYRGALTEAEVTSDSNLVYDNETAYFTDHTEGANTVITDPLIDEALNSCELAHNSPAIDAGVSLGSPYDVGYNGYRQDSAWDIGACPRKESPRRQ